MKKTGTRARLNKPRNRVAMHYVEQGQGHLSQFNLHGQDKVNTQRHLYCLVHNTEKSARSGWQE